jgi:cytochrome b561
MDIYSVLWRIHAILMGAAFAAMLTGFIIARAGRKKKWWFKVHRGLGSGGASGALAALAMAVLMISLTHGFHFGNAHTIVGIIAMVFITLTFILPALFRRVKKEAKLPLRRIHKASGVLSLGLMAASIVLGLTFVF